MRHRTALLVVGLLLTVGLLVAGPVLTPAAAATGAATADGSTHGPSVHSDGASPAGDELSPIDGDASDATSSPTAIAGPTAAASAAETDASAGIASAAAASGTTVTTNGSTTITTASPTTTDAAPTTADRTTTAESVPVDGPDEPIAIDYEFHLDDEDPLVVEITADVPAEYEDRDGEFVLDVFSAESESVETDGFEEELRLARDGTLYGPLTWDGETETPTATIEMSAIQSQWGGYNFYMDESWALADGGIDAQYVEAGHDRPAAIEEASAPEAAIGTHMTYVGAHEEHAIDAGGEEIRLVVPEGASIDEDEVTAALEDAGHDLRVGARPDGILAIAATDPIRPGGLAYLYPHSDLWAHEDVDIEIWIHEYVHTRQAYAPDESAQWLVEAEADYLPLALQYERGELSFAEFQHRLDADEPGGICSEADYENVVLSDPDTWGGTLADYCKGRLVLGALDAEIREATDGERTYADVMREFNDPAAGQQLSTADVQAAVEEVTGDSMDGFFSLYVHGEAVPDAPDDPDRYGAFDEFDVALEASLSEEPIVPGEETALPVTVENEGDDPAVGVEATLSVPDGWTVVDAGEGLPVEEGIAWEVSEMDANAELSDEVLLQAPEEVDDAPTLAVTDADGNEVEVSAGDETVAEPEAALAADAVAVEGDPAILDAGDSEADAGIDRYEWDLTGDGAVDETTTEPTLEHAFEEPGERTVTVTVVDEAGQEAVAEATVTVTDIPAVDAAPLTEPIVEGDEIAFEAAVENGVGDYEVTWTFPDGETATGETVEHAFDAGEHEVDVQVEDEYGATTSDVVSLTVTDVPELDVDAPDAAVEGDEIVFEAAVENEVGGYEVTWTFPDGETATGETVERDLEPGEHDVQVAVEDEHGAAASDAVTVTVTDVPTVAIDASEEVVLEGDPVSFEAAIENEVGDYDLTWEFPDGETATTETVEYELAAGEHEIDLLVEDEYGAAASDSVAITVADEPAIDVDAPDAAVAEEPVAFEATVENEVGDHEVTWTFPDGETATGETVEHAFEAGDTEVEVAVEDEFGLSANAAVTVRVTDVPEVSVDAPDEATAGETVTLEAHVENEVGDHEVTWEFPDGETATGETVEHAFEAGDHEIDVLVEDEYGATAEHTHVTTVVGEDDDEPAAGSDDSVPGFGPLVAIGALLVALAARHRLAA